MRILRKGGILGKENKEWRNVAEHCLVEAVIADILAELLGADRQRVVQAALLHDWHKRREVEAMRQACSAETYLKVAAEDERLLKRLGVPEDIIALAHSNVLRNADSGYLSQRALEEKIVHFVDHIFSGSQLTDVALRLALVKDRPNAVAMSRALSGQYGGKDHFEVTVSVATMEQYEFENILKLKPGTLLDFLQNQLKKRIEAVPLQRT